ncbi:hypothetical protein Pyn_32996 [Prunus yedoensis var. nudiflora]|uniref:Uncharacterized protein n=1 Tax=Prunus yedoensis var. nudiflora TaxID=2094558 RepID=A0A314YI06_PRUYE|nr:hypothetical protein Pyn_32996 [Prunus yedoensis var. nudiflora]
MASYVENNVLESISFKYRAGICSSSASDVDVFAAVPENMQHTQSTQNDEGAQPSMTESFLKEFDLIHGLCV